MNRRWDKSLFEDTQSSFVNMKYLYLDYVTIVPDHSPLSFLFPILETLTYHETSKNRSPIKKILSDVDVTLNNWDSWTNSDIILTFLEQNRSLKQLILTGYRGAFSNIGSQLESKISERDKCQGHCMDSIEKDYHDHSEFEELISEFEELKRRISD